MNKRSTILATIGLTSAMALSANAVATNVTSTTPANLSSSQTGLKVAVVEDAIGSFEIMSGEYALGVSKIETSDAGNFEKAIGLCAAYIKTDALSMATSACTKAIDTLTTDFKSSKHIQYLTAISYSNRAIARHLANDSNGALDDMTTAMLISDNSIVKSNLLTLKHQLFASNDDVLELAYSDAD